ncbi:hypothetical protein VOLCADRAFT_97503 [Volvox carteri f. nagariensis]|uniref:Uncharacterized protein n=1 Tax=Volvox carteri f. nagariensis TaxID=3068 RepID=D8UCW8_VOLCA|nr:uncharacterized protein VOLCADRAFT_97503 [Volvox carteri f. nagariensis]EFJ42415.1 hypothetical protein VOLCADRAFT_97503 [Volvox carteri f. nagariensis]|eukprot:XP_002956478.1 hypothetical protein VOLCADRAFT_97503 [Volvox carteri f. nagariensis]
MSAFGGKKGGRGRGCRFYARAGAVIDKQGQAFTRHVVVQVLKWLSDHAAACGANDTPWEQQTNVGDSGAPTAAAAAASAAQRQLLWEVLRLLVKHSEAGKTKQARGWLMGQLYQQYNADEYYGGSWLLSAINVITDGGYHCPSRRVAKLLSAQGLTVRYHILQASKPKTGCPLFVTTGLFFGEEFTNFMDALNSYDIPFTFLAPYRYPFNQCPFTSNETQLASYLSGIINAVAASSSPLPPRTSSLTSRLLKNTPSWKPWTATSNPVMNIDTAGPRVFEAADLLLDAKCQFWDDLLNADITAGTAFHS